MTSKIEVPRELLERLTECWNGTDARVELRALLAAPEAPRQEDRLPCDVRLPPSTTIRKGNTVKSLMRCIKLREGRPDCDRRFNEEMAEPMVSLSDHKKGLAAYAEHIEILKKQLTSPPAPLSPDHSGGGAGVVLPIRQPEQDCDYTQGWNACLDKLKELNQ